MEMKDAAESLEQSVQNADSKLDLIAWKIEQYENELKWVDSTEVSILKLLRSVNQVKEEYENLRREISEVQQLQKQLSDSLRLQLKLNSCCYAVAFFQFYELMTNILLLASL